MKYNVSTISHGVISHLNRDPRYKPLNPEDVEDLVKVLIRINPPTGIYDLNFADRVAAAIIREPKSYTTDALVKKTLPSCRTTQPQKDVFTGKIIPICYY